MAEAAGLSGAGGGEGAAVAPAATPSVGQPQQGGDQPGQARPGEAAPQQRTIKPIPPKKAAVERPQLPGVVKGEPGEREDFGFKPQRDDKGRFVGKGGEGEDLSPIEREMFARDDEAVEEQTPPGEATPEKKPALPPGAETPKTKFKFAGEEFETQEAAEQNFKSLRGMFKAKDESIRQLTDDRDYGYRGMEAWRAEVQKRDQEIAELRARIGGDTGTPAAPSGGEAQTPSGDALKEIVDSFDGKAFEMIAVQAGLPAAAQFLMKHVLSAVNEKLLPSVKAEVEQRFQPFEAEAQTRQVLDGVQALHGQVTALRLQDGSPAFPELNDPKTAREIGRVWKEFGHDPAAALTPQGLMSAVALYRMVYGGPAPSLTPSLTPPAAVAAQPAPAAPVAASLSADPRSGAPSTVPMTRHQTEVARIVRQLDGAPAVDPVLGFARRRAS